MHKLHVSKRKFPVLVILMTSALFIGSGAQAEVLLEPSLGLSTLGAKGTYNSNSINTTGTGLVGGLIFAKTERDWFAGLISNMYFMSYADTQVVSEVGYSVGFGIGGTLTYIPLRFYGSADMINGGNGLLGAARSGLRLGMTYYFTPMFALNVEAKSVASELETSGILANLSFLNINLSLPLELIYPTVPWREREIY